MRALLGVALVSTIKARLLAELRGDTTFAEQVAHELTPYFGRHDDGDLLTPAPAAAKLGKHPKTLTRAAADGRVVGAVRVGRSWRFRSGLTLLPPAGVTSTQAPPAKPRPRTQGVSAVTLAIRGNQQPPPGE